ncbi:MAG TPA: NACHT domain-containing protein [Steroidobacteraceae bacterium]|nr:NACHT domain-containing protein [Steroidobacteraceae bacterium]
MSELSPAVHRAIVCVDVEGFGDRRRTNPDQVAARDGLYYALDRAFARSEMSWDDCYHEDRGDGALILISPDVPKAFLVTDFPKELAAALREHNQVHDRPERIRLRLAIHAGEIHYDAHGVAGAAINMAFRLLEAPPLKRALAESPGVLAMIASRWFFDEVIRHTPASMPTSYRQVAVVVKETRDSAWICRPDAPYLLNELLRPEVIADSVLSNAIAVTGHQISRAVRKAHRFRYEDDVAIAHWFESYQLTSRNLNLTIPPELADQLVGVMGSHETLAAVHGLLAVRLAHATAMDAAQARQAFLLTLTAAAPGSADVAEILADYYDDQIRELVARLESQEPALVEEIKSERLPTRIVAVLRAIQRHAAALSSRPGLHQEMGFIARYRQHLIEQHGKLVPPDFDQRRLVPIGDIYVPTVIVEEDDRVTPPHELNVWQLAARIDRSVLLGDPGGGKTTAAKVLMNYFARKGPDDGQEWPVPFLVTVREYAVTYPPERSVAMHIEHELETFYQCPPPPGLVDLLLLTGRAVVIFDGLDELLDTSRRQDVAARVEHFCSEYPLTAVLVTSRLIGYDQARLDEGQFTCYYLGGFGEEQVGEYVRKWFAQDAEADASDAETFLAESAGIPDIRSNPLILALLCILYRGAGSLPRNRSEVYEECTNLLFRRWDARRKIHQELRAGHLLQAMLRQFSDFLLLRENAQSAVTERQLIREASEFLHSKGFESIDAAREAASEFVEFCRGRIWVFSDAGTTISGEKLYAFTHRTFLEYFAAAHLAYGNDTPERLADAIADHVARSDWLLVAEIAVQIKDRTCNDGAKRVYAALFNGLARRPHDEQDGLLRFLALCLRSVDPSPQCIRELVRRIIGHACETDARSLSTLKANQLSGTEAPNPAPTYLALPVLLAGSGSYRDLVAEEIDATLADRIQSSGGGTLGSDIRLMASLPYALPSWDSSDSELDFWITRASNNINTHSVAVTTAAEIDAYIRLIALAYHLITVKAALAMPGGPTVLFQESHGCFAHYEPYFINVFRALDGRWPSSDEIQIIGDLEAFGEYLLDHPTPPWIKGAACYANHNASRDGYSVKSAPKLDDLSRPAFLGAAAIIAILAESNQKTARQPFSSIPELVPYQTFRRNTESRIRPLWDVDKLQDLPVPREFELIFRKWAVLGVAVTSEQIEPQPRDWNMIG